MEPAEQTIRNVLEMLVSGATCDHQFVRGGVMAVNREGKAESIDDNTFLYLKDNGFIAYQGIKDKFHPIFRASFNNPIGIYVITDAGREYLKR